MPFLARWVMLFPLFTRVFRKGCRMALPLGSVKGTRETPRRPLHHSGAALPAERDAQKRFLNGGVSEYKFGVQIRKRLC